MEKSKKYRYPGINYFTKEEKAIFCGREDDAQKLFHRIMLNNTIVLHGESGSGKSSLVQAGLIPLLEEQNRSSRKPNKPFYLPVTIRFDSIKKTSDQSKNDLLVSYTLKIINNEYSNHRANSLPYISEKINSFWYTAKLFEQNNYTLLLIFDQFEALQSFDYEQVENFTQKLSELFVSTMPEEIYNEYDKATPDLFNKKELSVEIKKEYNQNIKFLEQALNVKILFVVREDKLGTMSLLTDYFSDILKNDFALKLLTKKNAFNSIVNPTKVEGEFESAPFEFQNENIVWNLIEQIADNKTGLVDPIQLQIVASNIEKKTVIGNEKKNEQGKIIVSQNDIPEITDIINRFYVDCWEKVKNDLGLDEPQLLEIKRIIISKLVVNDRKSLADFGKVNNNDLLYKTVEVLDAEGLIREIIIDKIAYYQLCHDRFIKPINEDHLRLIEEEKTVLKAIEDKKRSEELIEQQRKEFDETLKEVEKKKKAKRKIRNRLIAIGVASAIFFSYKYNESLKNNEKIMGEKVLACANMLRGTNPSFAYFLLKKFQEKHPSGSDAIDNKIKFYENANAAFQLGSYPYSFRIVNVDEPDDSTLIITDKYTIRTWNTKTKLISSEKKLLKGQGYYLTKKKINNKEYNLVINDDSVEFQDAKGRIEKKFPAPIKDENIVISKNGKYIVLGDSVFNFQTQKLIGALPLYRYTTDQTATVFLNDCRHIAVAYASGYIYIFRIDESQNYKIRVSAVYAAELVNDAINCLAVDSKDEYLYAGNIKKNIEVWQLDSLDVIDRMSYKMTKEAHINLITKKFSSTLPSKILKGHTNNVNAIEISPDDKFLLSGSNDNSAILWDLKTGKKVSFLMGRQSMIKQVGFFGNNTRMFTGTEDELLIVWSKEKASKLYATNQLSPFSPFDFYAIGLAKEDEFKGTIYKKATTTANLFRNTLDYIISLPLINQYPLDSDYLDNLKLSLAEIDTMYAMLIKRKDYTTFLKPESKKLLFKYYNLLKLETPVLLLEAENEDKPSKYKRYAKHHLQNMNILFADTSDIISAISNAKDFNTIARYYLDSLKKYDTSAFYYEKAKTILETFFSKFKKDEDLKEELSNIYGSLSWNYLFNHKYDQVIKNAHSSVSLDSLKNNWVNTNLALGYLFSGKFNEAEKKYTDFSKRNYYDNSKTFKKAFLDDFKDLEEKGIINKKDTTIYNEVTKIKNTILK